MVLMDILIFNSNILVDLNLKPMHQVSGKIKQANGLINTLLKVL